MSVGPCGLACLQCREFLDRQCGGCVRGDTAADRRLATSPCLVVRCATAFGVPYCMRDCERFPCDLYTQGQLFCQSRAATHERQVPHPLGSAAGARGAPGRDERPLPTELPVRVRTLGAFHVFVGEREIRDADWSRGRGPTDKVKALFAFLVSGDIRGARRDRLIDLLWPDQLDSRRAASSLHLAMHCLRRALEPDRPAGAESRFIRFDGQRYRFAVHDASWVDADAFERHCDAAGAASAGGDSPRAVREWMAAVSLYGGDYLAGLRSAYTEDGFYDWCLPRREDLRGRYVVALAMLAESQARAGDLDAGLRLARQALQADPLCAQAEDTLLRCLQDRGQAAAAEVERRVWAERRLRGPRGAEA